MTIEILGTITTILAVIGVLLNNRKLIVCYGFWLVSNAISAGIHLNAHLWSMAIRDLIFLVLAVEGIIRWRK